MDTEYRSLARAHDAISESGESDISWQSVSSIDPASHISTPSAASWHTTDDLEASHLSLTKRLVYQPATPRADGASDDPSTQLSDSSDASASLVEKVSATDPSDWSDVGSSSVDTVSLDGVHDVSMVGRAEPIPLFFVTTRQVKQRASWASRDEAAWPRVPRGDVPARGNDPTVNDTESNNENASTFSGFQSITDTAPYHTHIDSRSLTPTPSGSSNVKATPEPLVLEQISHIDALCAESNQHELSRFATELVLECNRLRQQANASLSAWEIMNSRIGATEVEGWATFLIVNADDPINVASIGQRMLDEVERVRKTSRDIKEQHRDRPIHQPLRTANQESDTPFSSDDYKPNGDVKASIDLDAELLELRRSIESLPLKRAR